jgi:hypothetical protein
MKLGNPKHVKYGIRKLAKGGTMLHFKVLVFNVFQFELLVYGHFLVSPSGLRRVL